MILLLILAALLIAAWLWATWQRDGVASAMGEWSYGLLVVAITCIVMAIGIWLR